MGQQDLLCAPYSMSLQQACEMVMDILRERDQGGFGDRNEYGSRIGGGIDVSTGLPQKIEGHGVGMRGFLCPLASKGSRAAGAELD